MQRFACILTAAALCFAPAPADADSYTLTVDTPDAVIHVSAELDHFDGNEKICLPAFGQRRGESFRNIEFRHIQKAPKLDESGCFKPDRTERIGISYDLRMAPLGHGAFWQASQLSPYNAGTWLSFPGESLFVERHVGTGRKTGPTTVAVRSAGPVVSTLQTAPKTEKMQNFTASGDYELTRSFWTFDNPRVMMATSGGIAWTMAVDPAWMPPIDAIKREIVRILDYYAAAIPAKTPQHVAVFIFGAPFDADYHHGFARHGGIILQMGQKSAARAAERRILMAHEIFHLYNGENLKFDPAEYADTGWFREGMTQYIAMQSLLALDLIDTGQVCEWMTKSIERHRGNHRDIGENPYHIGYFISLGFEQQWRIYATPHTLLGFWKWLSTGPDWDVLYTNDALRKRLTEYSHFDFNSFFKRYIFGAVPLPIRSILAQSGLCLVPASVPIFSTGLEYAFDPKTASIAVSRIAPESPAYQAGIRKGDIIIPAPHTSWTDGSDKYFEIKRGSEIVKFRLPPVGVTKNTEIVTPCR